MLIIFFIVPFLRNLLSLSGISMLPEHLPTASMASDSSRIENELEKKQVKLRDMNSGKEQLMTLAHAIEEMKK